MTSLSLIKQEAWRREKLSKLITQLKTSLHSLRWPLMPSMTPIQPLLVGGNDEAMHLSAALRDRGILVPAIRPPTVPEGKARLRISLSAAHREEDVEQLSETLHDLAKIISS
jgi:8-amino-7-oxononanoate synthase